MFVNFIKRGILSVLRRPIKSLILLLIIFILGDVMAGAISVEQAINKAQKNVLNKTGAIATLEIDYEKTSNLNGDDFQKKVKSISIDTVNRIGKSKYLSYYDFTTSYSLQTNTLKRYATDDYPILKGDIDLSSSVIRGELADNPNQTEYFNITGIQEKNMVDIQVGKIKLVGGRKFTDEEIENLKYVAIISKNFADTNNLNIGSKINLENVVVKIDDSIKPLYRESTYDSKIGIDSGIQAKQELEFEVVGIFEVIRPATKDSSNDYMYNELENKIYTTNKVVENIINFTKNEYKKTNPEYAEQLANTNYITPLFVIKNPLDLDKFKESIKNDIPEYYKSTDNSNTYQKVAAPMKNMKWISSIVLYVAAGATLLILSLLITLFLRDRRHEIGIYLALGERKLRVISQIVFEVVVVAFTSITLSLFVGGLIASSISKKTLNNQMIEDVNGRKDIGIQYGESSLDWMGYSTNVTSEDLMSAYKISLNGGTIIMFYLIGLGTVLISTIVPIVYVTKLRPKKILM
jgi:putative ABC transport system permease protein